MNNTTKQHMHKGESQHVEVIISEATSEDQLNDNSYIVPEF